MARDGFYDENRGRGYPLLAGLVGDAAPGPNPGTLNYLPLPVLIDFGCIMGLDSQFVEDEDSVYLYRVSRSGSIFRLEFRSTAAGLVGASLIFRRTLDADKFAVEYVDDENDDSDDSDNSDSPCVDEPLWSGFLVTGDLTELAELLADGQQLLGGSTYLVEPALVRSLVDGYLRSISVANAERTRAESPEGCRPPCWPFALAEHYVYRRCLQGPIRFQDGYNSVIRVDAGRNTIEFAAGEGAGAGVPCEEVPLYPQEAAPQGSELLTGGPRCNEVVRSVNGLGGPRLNIEAGNGVSLLVLPTQHRIKIGVNFNDTPGCNDVDTSQDNCDDSDDLGSDDSGDSSDSDAPTDDCDCGPLENL